MTTSRTTLENLRNRVEEFVSQNSERRIAGVVVQSPKLCDGSIEVRTGMTVFFMTPEQIAYVQAAFPHHCDGPSTDLPTHPNRKQMTNDLLAEYLAVLERRAAEYAPPIATEERT